MLNTIKVWGRMGLEFDYDEEYDIASMAAYESLTTSAIIKTIVSYQVDKEVVKMTGSLQERNGKYHIVLNYKDKSGNRKQKWMSTGLEVKGNKRNAEKMLTEYIVKFEKEYEFWENEIYFVDYIKLWLKKKKPQVEQSSYEGYEIYANKHIIPYFEPLNLKLTDVKVRHIQDYYNYKLEKGNLKTSKGLNVQSIQKHSIVIKQALNDAVLNGLIGINVANSVPLPKQQQISKCKFLTVDESQKLLCNSKDDTLYPLICVTLYYGLRKSEVLGLKWNAVDFEKNEISIRHTVVKNRTIVAKDKTKSSFSRRSFPLLPEIREMLLDLKEKEKSNRKLFGKEYIENDYIFKWNNGQTFRPDFITRHFQKLLAKSGLEKMRFHDLRHSCASMLLDKGWSLKQIQEWLGHADIETTGNIYVHLYQNKKKEMGMDLSHTFSL